MVKSPYRALTTKLRILLSSVFTIRLQKQLETSFRNASGAVALCEGVFQDKRFNRFKCRINFALISRLKEI